MQHCSTCGNEITVYELYPRSYRLYIYLCRKCRKGFLAHHFDLNLEIYQMEEVGMKQKDGLIFITGLKAEPRVFDFNVDKESAVVIVADEKNALGELALTKQPVFAPYSNKALRTVKRFTGLSLESDPGAVSEKISKLWGAVA